MNLNLIGLTQVQRCAAEEIAPMLGIDLQENGLPIYFKQQGEGISISREGSLCTVHYQEPHMLFRALGLLTERMHEGLDFNLEEQPVYEELGVLIDCSRNAVLKMEAFQKLIRHLALMGFSNVQLYTEDTYEMKGYPYFGYMRGRYQAEEMKAMDRYAGQFGIELIPSIQTLAHLGSALKWEAFSDVQDHEDILLVGEEKTYELIEAMFQTMADNLKSRRINIGMDEAHMLGLGHYLKRHGYQDRTALMLRHFQRVIEIARKYGYEPMMWSDMFFRLASGGEYYESNSPISQKVIEQIPDDLTLVYWDYYSTEKAQYDAMLTKHKQLGSRLAFAGGAWKWLGFSPNNQFSQFIGRKAHDACKLHGIKEVLITAWGDNGAEASVFSILPTLQYWAELCYAGHAEEAYLRTRFMTCTSARYEDFMMLDKLMVRDPDRLAENYLCNPSKYLLYQDILCGLFDKHVNETADPEYFKECAKTYQDCAERNPEWAYLFNTLYRLSAVLERKSALGNRLRAAYLRQDDEALIQFSQIELPGLKKELDAFAAAYHQQWFRENKAFGLDVFDIRIGGLLQRLQTAIQRIEAYIRGDLSSIEELEEPLLFFEIAEQEKDNTEISNNLWHTIATASVINGI